MLQSQSYEGEAVRRSEVVGFFGRAARPLRKPKGRSSAAKPFVLRLRPFAWSIRIERPDYEIASRLVDIILCILVLIVVFPLMTLAAVIIFLQDGGPVFFVQRRIGRAGKIFGCLKFRSMAVDAEAQLHRLLSTDAEARAEWERDHKLRRDPRITAFGAFLRKSSIDELPQLFNVLKGDMSLVGPRPIVPAEIPRYGRRFAHYCSVRPGITGLWQVSGRNDVSYRSRVAMDVLYARCRSLRLDLWLLAATVRAVLLRRGSY